MACDLGFLEALHSVNRRHNNYGVETYRLVTKMSNRSAQSTKAVFLRVKSDRPTEEIGFLHSEVLHWPVLAHRCFQMHVNDITDGTEFQCLMFVEKTNILGAASDKSNGSASGQ